MSLKTELQAAIAYCNQKLTAKGAQTASTVYGIGDRIENIAIGIFPQAYAWQQIPTPVKNYLDNVTYDPSDYTTSQIDTYAPAVAVAANSIPVGKTFAASAGTLNRNGYEEAVSTGDVTAYNDIPNQRTPYTVYGSSGAVSQSGTLMPNGGTLRQIKCATAPNVRDLGGWACDGGTVKYGVLFRGGQPAANDHEVLVNQCGVRFELSLIGSGAETGTSILGDDVQYQRFGSYAWYSLSDTTLWQQMLRALFDNVFAEKPVFFHCQAGADRTGTFACIIEALLGMSQSDIDKDYELTCFYTGTETYQEARKRNETEWKGLITQINEKFGSSFKQKVINWVGSLGFTETEVNNFRKAVINGNPQEVHFESQITNLVETYQDNSRYSTSGTIKEASGLFVVTNYIERQNNDDVFRIRITGATANDLTAMLSNNSLYMFEYYSADGESFTTKQYQQALAGSTAWTVETGSDGEPCLVGYSNTTKNQVPWAYPADTSQPQGWNYFRIGLAGSGANCIITRNQEF